MKDIEQLFAIKRANGIGMPVFKYGSTEDIPIGVEGRKMLAQVEATNGRRLGKYFFKELKNEEAGEIQVEKWKFLKDRGVSVPSVFKPVVLADGTNCLVVQDLSDNGHYQVVGLDSPEIDTEEYLKASTKISAPARTKIVADLVSACEAASGLRDNVADVDRVTLELWQNAFILALNLTNPDDMLVYVADLGLDVIDRSNNKWMTPQKVFESSLRAAGFFYTSMTGENFQLPADNPLADEMNPEFIRLGNQILEKRGYKT